MQACIYSKISFLGFALLLLKMAQGTNIFLEQKLANFNHFIYLFFLSMKTEVTIFLRSY